MHPLSRRDFVTPSNVNLCHSFLASILSRKWLNAGVGHFTQKAFSLGVGDKKDLGNELNPFGRDS